MKQEYLNQNKINLLIFKIGLIVLLLVKFSTVTFGDTNTGRENPGFQPIVYSPILPQTDPNLKTKITESPNNSDKFSENEFKSASYPNPFISSTTIEFESGQDANAAVEIFSITGSKVAELFNDKIQANTLYKVNWDAANFPAGIYFYKIIYGDKMKSGRLVLSK